MGSKARPRTAWQKEAERALISSIAHWDRLATGRERMGETTGSDDCACCAIWLNDSCVGCPIATRTGDASCRSTPYAAAINSTPYAAAISSPTPYAFRKAAAKERAFLKQTLRLVQLGKVNFVAHED